MATRHADFFETFARNKQAMTTLAVVIVVLLFAYIYMVLMKSGIGD